MTLHDDMAGPLDVDLPDPPPMDERVAAGELDATEVEDDKASAPAAVKLVKLARDEYELGITDDGEPFAYAADAPHLARMFREGRNGLRARLAQQFYAQEHRAAPNQALADALLILEGMAGDTDPTRLHLRMAEHGNRVYIDAGDQDGTVYEISRGTWTVTPSCPVVFRRTALTAAFPKVDGLNTTAGEVFDLFDCLNVRPEFHRLVIGWLVSALILQDVPHPVMTLLAEAGTSKSTTTRRMVSMADPSAAPLRTAPRAEDQWITAASGSWVVGLDNVSHIPPWLSDSLCRAVTGDGDVRRRLYSNGDLHVLQFRRCCIINGIDLGGIRGDLADRMCVVELEPIPENKRQSEEALNRQWDEDYPRLFSALLDFAALVHQELSHVTLEEMPRMADFARVLQATDTIAAKVGHKGPSGLATFLDRSKSLARESLQADPFIVGVLRLADLGKVEAKSAAEILAAVELDAKAAEQFWRAPKGWPTSGRAASGRLKRHAPQMRKTGYTVTDDDGRNKAKTLRWTISPTTTEGAE